MRAHIDAYQYSKIHSSHAGQAKPVSSFTTIPITLFSFLQNISFIFFKRAI